MPRYSHSTRKRSRSATRTPEAAGIAAVATTMRRRLYNQRKQVAMAEAQSAAAGITYAPGGLMGRGADRSKEYRGYGDYFGKAAGSFLGGKLGGYLGLSGGSDLGGQIGDRAGDWFKSKFGGRGMYTGHGDYTHNALIHDGGGSESAPLFGGHFNDVVMTHREYITDIYGPPVGNSFLVQSYSLNPALSQTFPFLSQLAANFDEYEFIQMIWTYKSTTTDIGNSTTGQCGTVVQCANYNAANPPFQYKGIMMEYFGAVSCKVTESSRCGIECDPSKNAGAPILYTRSNPVVTGQDLKTYDLGTYQLAVCNSPAAYANLPIGELWVDYTVKLRKPKLFVSRGLEIDKDSWLTNIIAPISATLTPAAPFGSAGTSLFLTAQQGNIGSQIVPGITYAYAGTTNPTQTATSTGFSIILPAAFNGNLRLTLLITGSGINGTPVLRYSGNIVPINDQYFINGDPVDYSSSFSLTTAILIVDMYAKQASAIAYNSATGSYSGGNNIINFLSMVGQATTITSMSVQLEQYQALGGINGMSLSTNRVPWLNASGVIVIP